ncbi:CHAP domain-containing protein [Mariniflexile ostreae]|uniref:CHAP domain-containing protein n=1 Tax=Mariniflexile ostreae TaxID=1520892 RepID=A0ABV5FCL1_9FLAO
MWEVTQEVNSWYSKGLTKKNTYKTDVSTCEFGTSAGNNESATKAPWMSFAEREYITYQGIMEKDSPLKEKIEIYFNTTNSKGSNHEIPWCGAFLNWCFEQTDDYKKTNTGLNALAFDWGNKETANKSKHKPDGWLNGEETTPFYGAVIVLSYSHVAFVIGENKEGTKYVYLGGNQGSKISGMQKICYGTVTKGNESCIMKPKNYIIKDEDKKLKKFNVDADGSASSTR